MNNRSVALNYIYNLVYQLLTMIIPVITIPYLSRTLGPENIGIFGFTLSICTYFVLFGSLGIVLYGQREIAYYQNDVFKRSLVFFEIFLMRFITLGFSTILYYLFFCNIGEYAIYYKILTLELLANLLDISWFFRGLEEFKKTVVRNIVVKLLSVICITIFVKDNNDLDIYLIIYVLSNLIGNISLWIYMPKFIRKINIKDLNIFRHFKPTLLLFIPQVAIQLYTVLDKTMIGFFINDKSQVGFYEQAEKIVKLLLTIATSLGVVMMPRIASTYANGDKKKIMKYMNTSFSFITMLTFPLTFGIISISDSFVPLFFGPGYEFVSILIKILSPILIAMGFSNIIGTQYLIPTKQQKKFTISVTCGALINFCLNLILINSLQSLGASIATVVAEFLVTGVQFYLIRNEISIKEVFKLSYKYFISSIIMFCINIVLNYLIYGNLATIIIQILVSVLVYFLLLILLKDAFLLKLVSILETKIKNKTKSFM